MTPGVPMFRRIMPMIMLGCILSSGCGLDHCRYFTWEIYRAIPASSDDPDIYVYTLTRGTTGGKDYGGFPFAEIREPDGGFWELGVYSPKPNNWSVRYIAP
jgi:hypothetical protein